MHKKCAAQLPMNCQISENAITPSFDQLSMSDAASLVSANDEELATHQGNDSMIPLARLPGKDQ